MWEIFMDQRYLYSKLFPSRFDWMSWARTSSPYARWTKCWSWDSLFCPLWARWGWYIVLVSGGDLHFTVGGLVESPTATAGPASRHPLPSQRCQGQPLPRPPRSPSLLPPSHSLVTTLLGEDTEVRGGRAPSQLGSLSYDESFLNSFLFVPS